MKTLINSLVIAISSCALFGFTSLLAHDGGHGGHGRGGFHGGGFHGGGGFPGGRFHGGGFHGGGFHGGGVIYQPYPYYNYPTNTYPSNNCQTILTYAYQCDNYSCGYYPVYSIRCYNDYY
jgi:hypothetical protein